MFDLRDARPEDLPAIVAIYNSVVPSRMVTADTEPVTVESRKHWFEVHDPRRRPLWVVESNDQMAGWVSFQSFYERPAYEATVEISVYLDPSFRGRGIGKEVLAESLTRAADLGLRNIVGFIFAHNEPSLRLFRSRGFSEWGSLPDACEMDGVRRSVVILGKALMPCNSASAAATHTLY